MPRQSPFRRSSAHPPRPAPRGLSLVELVVVTAILSILAVGVSLSVGRGPARDDAQVFAALYAQQRDLAIAGQDLRGIELGPEGIRAGRRTADGWAWGPARPIVAQPDGPTRALRVLLLPTGQTTAFGATFADATRCATDGWTGLTCDG